MKSFAVLGYFSIPHETHYQLGKYLSISGRVYFGIVRFFKDGREVITKSRPLYGHERKSIIDAWGFETFFWDFHNPYIKYLLPKYAEEMKQEILEQLPEDTVFYTRSPYSAFVLKQLKLKAEYSPRTGTSGTSIREKIYAGEVRTENLPEETLDVLRRVSSRLEKLANDKDRTLKLFDFKIPVEGFLK
jgi:hypothetical protein